MPEERTLRPMTRRQLSAVAFKVAGIYFLVVALFHLTWFLPWMAEPAVAFLAEGWGGLKPLLKMWPIPVGALVNVSLHTGLAAFLIHYSNALAGRLHRDPAQASGSAGPLDILATAAALIGLGVFASAFLQVVYLANHVSVLLSSPEDDWAQGVQRYIGFDFLGMGVRFALGAGLFFGSRRLARWWFRRSGFSEHKGELPAVTSAPRAPAAG